MLSGKPTYSIKSGPPAMAWVEYSQLVTRDWTALLDQGDVASEATFQSFLETHPCMVPGGQSMSGPSGHSAYPAALIAQPRLPGFMERIPDFLWIATDSLHIYPVLIEIESPSKKMFTRGGQPTADFTQAQTQLTHWKRWFSQPANHQIFKEHFCDFGHAKWRTLLPQYVLIYGRRSEIEARPELNSIRAHLSRTDEYYMTFDRLHPIRDHDQYMTTRVSNGRLEAISVPPTLELGPLLAHYRSHIFGKELAVRTSPYLSNERREFVAVRFKYWDDWAKNGERGMTNLGDRE
ncbi:Shedu anti-phage system protein SduA domain-containing protein [Rhizobium lentis]|uniref:DUF4263 domain-containing protein n=1 Tax=Rhizobium lentis TaxID=1138194 RepID=A0A9Q3MEL8_9HYPH|nr:Shedu anti-phage system protein SduA domain-containing protein [Rhizobium lentis]MBX5024474.1 DUF4263 domain-containing protein [Rhizobium lentis]MBX5049172.1 DUF4263 domain-containing protein [Rhizobium lentis]MBX5060854.1 DUF4263 domain-containing protein [Rhizobium lentis]